MPRNERDDPSVRELISNRVRTAAREDMVGFTLAQIRDLFEVEGFLAVDQPDRFGGQRRNYVEQFYADIDWANWDDVSRFISILEAVLPTREYVDLNGSSELERLLLREGFTIDPAGAIRPAGGLLTAPPVTNLPSDSAIPDHLRRMWTFVTDRPEQSISAAKDAIEATAKHVLHELGDTLTGREDLPELVRHTQQKLKLHASSVAPDQTGADVIVKILGSLAALALSTNELRNLYGDGHGRVKKVAGLTSRHSRLVARCTEAYVGMLLETLDAPGAPWQVRRSG